MKYVGNLWDEKQLADRLNSLMKLSRTKAEGGEGITFRNFYTLLPPKGSSNPSPRTFIILPKANTGANPDPAKYFLPAENHVAEDEVEAHTGMFNAKTNDGYYGLGLRVVDVIRNALGDFTATAPDGDNFVEGETTQKEKASEPSAAHPETEVGKGKEVDPQETDLMDMEAEGTNVPPRADSA